MNTEEEDRKGKKMPQEKKAEAIRVNCLIY